MLMRLLLLLAAVQHLLTCCSVCVRRSKTSQNPRIIARCQASADLLEVQNPVIDSDIDINDDILAPIYGNMNDKVLQAITLGAHKEGIILDPVYTGKSMAAFLKRVRQAKSGHNLLFLHIGGQPAIFGYESDLEPMMSAKFNVI